MSLKLTKVVHNDKLKPCDDQFIPLWIRSRRQELQSLDHTPPYDADEHSFFNISDLFAQNDPQEKDLVVDDNIPPMDDQPEMEDQSILAGTSVHDSNNREIPQTSGVIDVPDDEDGLFSNDGVDVIAVQCSWGMQQIPMHRMKGVTLHEALEGVGKSFLSFSSLPHP